MRQIEVSTKGTVNKRVKADARRVLNGSELRLYSYLLEMAEVCEDNTFPLSRKDACESYGMSKASFQRAVDGLKLKGYLQKNNNILLFDALGGFEK